ncbi:MAG: DsbC family protein [Candidatus Thiodiazotropha sp.]
MEKMSISTLGVLLAILLSGPFATGAELPTALPGNGEVWLQALPNTAIREIQPEPRFPGMYEIVLGDKLVYGDATGRYLMFGHLYDVRTQQDLTQQRLDAIAAARRIPWEELPLEHALRENLAPRGAPKLAVLFNPQCAWCRKLYSDVRSEKDKEGGIVRRGIEFEADVRFMMLAPEKPASSKSPDFHAHYLADRIVCGGSPELNLQVVMHDEAFQARFQADPFEAVFSPASPLVRKPLPGKQDGCDSEPVLDAVRAFSRKHGLSGTPVLISGDGRIHRGYLPPDRLLTWLRDSGTGSGGHNDITREGEPQ